MTRTEAIEALANKTGFDKKDVKRFLDAARGAIP
jgi:nucleoid DNA-binding protein